MEPFFKLFERNIRNVTIVKIGEWQFEIGAEFVERQSWGACLFEDVVGRFPDTGEVVYKRAGPVKNNIPNHGRVPYTSCAVEVSSI